MSDALAETPLDERDALYLGRAITISNQPGCAATDRSAR